jgi:biotin carboxylase
MIRRQRLAIIGASYLQKPLVETANSLGIETHCFAWEEGAICKTICDFFYPISVLDKKAILKICQKIGIDGITTIATDIAMPTVAYVAEKMDLTSNSIQSSLWATNKALMRERFLLGGVNSPKFLVLNNQKDLPNYPLTYPVIVKPVDRSGSRGISKVKSPRDLSESLSLALEESLLGKAIIEEFIEGREVSVESISWKGKHYILAITDKITTGDPHFVELEHHQPSLLPKEIILKIKSLTINALNCLEVENGAGHTEIKIDKVGKVFIIEVGARMGGDFIGSHLVKLSTGYDFLKGVIEISLNKFTEPHIKDSAYSGVYFLSKESQRILPFIHSKNDFDVKKEITSNSLSFLKNSNDRSGYLIYKSDGRVKL